MSLEYFEQLEQNINRLLSDKKLKEAYLLCKEILEKFPDEKRFMKLKARIEELALDENDKIVKEKLNELDKLWDEENYTVILKELKNLLLISPENHKLKKLYQKAEIAYTNKIEKLKKEFKQKQIIRLNELLDNNPMELLDELFNLERANPEDEEMHVLTTSYRDKLIAKRIEEKEELLKSDKYDDINNFIKQLRRIDDKNARIINLVRMVENRRMRNQFEKQNEFVYQGLEHLDTLMKLKKFDKVVQAANEILLVDKNNKTIKEILNNAKRKLFKQTRNLAINSIINNKNNLKKEYNQNPSNFIKI